jgi:murein DD-endopeptidase MepM/ murein hydrolase activator NlpD
LGLHHLKATGKETLKIYTLDSLLMWTKWIDTILKVTLSTSDSILKKVPSILPVDGYIIKYFGKQVDPFTDKEKPQYGIDILASLNSPIIATGGGKVLKIAQKKGLGLYVEIAHWRDFITLYGHLLSTTVKEGDFVKRGDIIGYVGESGRAPYPYLYYEVRKDSVYIDPLDVIIGGI